MKRYIQSSATQDYFKDFEFKREDGWTDEDIELWKSIDWDARNFEEYPVENDTFKSMVVLYGKGEPIVKHTKFMKFLRPNPIYPPYYAPVDEDPFPDCHPYVGPMYDGRSHNGVDLHDRYETQRLYDALFD